MDTNLQPVPPAGTIRHPGPSADDWNDPKVFARIAGLPASPTGVLAGLLSHVVPTAADLVETYGTCDPKKLAEVPFVLDADLAAARRLAEASGAAA